MSTTAAQKLIETRLIELTGQNNTPTYTPTDMSDLLLDILLTLDYEDEVVVTPEELVASLASIS